MVVNLSQKFNNTEMKIFLASLFLLWSFIGISQIKMIKDPPMPIVETTQFSTNVSCASSQKVCNSINSEYKFDEKSSVPCGTNDLYYTFDFPGSNLLGIQINVSPGGTWSWYGPFTDLNLSVCDQINNYSAPSTSGTFNGPLSLTNSSGGIYILKITPTTCTGSVSINVPQNVRLNCKEEVECTECVTSFSPTPGKYILSAWVKEDGASNSVTTYTNSSIKVSYTGSTQAFDVMLPSGAIIDGWQRIEAELSVPNDATGLSIELIAGGADVFFDDIRFFPTDGSMMSYVYDPVSLRLMAELDERNYATLYEYDEEGKLIRVKKETERGIMTIQENRDNIKKQ